MQGTRPTTHSQHQRHLCFEQQSAPVGLEAHIMHILAELRSRLQQWHRLRNLHDGILLQYD
jgi:hypothetical protein